MFGRDTEEVKLQKAMRLAGADPTFVKVWFKNLEKMRKINQSVSKAYEDAFHSTERLVELLEQMEKQLLGVDRVVSDQDRRALGECRKQMKQLQGRCDHAFVVSPDDREFHSTFDALLTLEPGLEANAQETLILQSEIENLLACARENLEREKPSLAWLCYYSANRSVRELEKLAPEERLDKVRRIYRKEFIERMRSVLADCIQEAHRIREASGHLDKGMEILLSRESEQERGGLLMAKTREDFEMQADAFLVSLCEFEA